MISITTFLTYVGYFTTILFILGVLWAAILWARGIIPVLYRLGKGLSGNKIMIFAATDNASSLENMLIESGLFQKQNISHISSIDDLERTEGFSLFLVYWPDWEDNIRKILTQKTKKTALILYAPHVIDPATGKPKIVPKEIMSELNEKLNITLVNFRGRLLNDILVSMITKSYQK